MQVPYDSEYDRKLERDPDLRNAKMQVRSDSELHEDLELRNATIHVRF